MLIRFATFGIFIRGHALMGVIEYAPDNAHADDLGCACPAFRLGLDFNLNLFLFGGGLLVILLAFLRLAFLLIRGFLVFFAFLLVFALVLLFLFVGFFFILAPFGGIILIA